MRQFILGTWSRRSFLVTAVAFSLAAAVPVAFAEESTTPKDCSQPIPYPEMAGPKDWAAATSIYQFVAKDLDEKEVSLEKFRGHPLIVVNVATHCGLTKTNYKQLNELYAKYKEKGLRILAFPCNQFNNQEPGCAVDIKEFLTKNNVEFDVFSKINVNGDGAHPLYKWLKIKQKGTLGDAIKWNFTKFLVNKEGVPVNRYAPTTEPKDIEDDLKALL